LPQSVIVKIFKKDLSNGTATKSALKEKLCIVTFFLPLPTIFGLFINFGPTVTKTDEKMSVGCLKQLQQARSLYLCKE